MVYMCIYICVYLYTHTYIHIYIPLYACMYVCMYACMYVCVYIYICIGIFSDRCIYTYASTNNHCLHTQHMQMFTCSCIAFRIDFPVQWTPRTRSEDGHPFRCFDLTRFQSKKAPRPEHYPQYPKSLTFS